jgi:hypothetical protein
VLAVLAAVFSGAMKEQLPRNIDILPPQLADLPAEVQDCNRGP